MKEKGGVEVSLEGGEKEKEGCPAKLAGDETPADTPRSD